MDYWLVKSEPHKYSWEKFNEQGRTFWDGVRNYMARNNLRGMKEGDLVLFYHSNEGKEVVGIAKVVKEFSVQRGPKLVIEHCDVSAVRCAIHVL